MEITAQFDDDQAEILKQFIGKSVLIDRATVEAVYFGRVVVKMKIVPVTEIEDTLSHVAKILPQLVEDQKVALEWEKLTGSREPYEYLSTRAAKEWGKPD